MLKAINDQFNAKKNSLQADQFIAESALDVEEILPGSEEEIDDLVDVDSVPDEIYKKVDSALEKLLADKGYDDTEVEELIDEDDDIDDEEIDIAIDEAVGDEAWEDDESIGHPDVDDQDDDPDDHEQPEFDPE